MEEAEAGLEGLRTEGVVSKADSSGKKDELVQDCYEWMFMVRDVNSCSKR